jgi:uncharacterized protein with beta-barrel porin domain
MDPRGPVQYQYRKGCVSDIGNSVTTVWACPKGVAAAGLAGRPVSPRLRGAFLGTVAAGALSVAFAGPALAGPVPVGCTLSGGGTVETCTGDQHNGVVASPPPVTTLNVNNLTTAITPASGTPGISFKSTGAITITSNTGAFGITTTGTQANGIFAQSIVSGAVTVTSTGNITTGGGGGSNGIFANGLGAVTVTSAGNITTASFGEYGINASGTAAVTVTSTGNITTGGSTSSTAISAGSAVSGATVTSTGNIATAGDHSYGIIAFGSGAVSVTSTGNITTAGNSSYGIVAAGAGAVSVTSTGNITTTGIQAAAIRVSQDSNDAGALTVTSTGNITTTGDAAFGIRVFQSSGDTGALTVTTTGNISTAGAVTRGIEAISAGAGAVSVASIGNITAQGSGSIGIFAVGNNAVTLTSTGNITLLGNDSTGLQAFGQGSGAVTLTSTGNVSTTGSNSTAILGQSNSGPIAITIKSGTVSGGTGTGAGVDLVGGTTNTLTNFGTLMALSGLAITGDTGNNTVNNFGTVIGNVVLGTGTNAFNNMAGGLFNSGATVNLGAGNTLTNAGTLSPGGAGVIGTTALTGNLVQTGTGIFLTDINIAGAASDRINVSGTANLAGAVQLQVSNLTFAPWQQTVLSAAGGTTNNGLTLLASPALQAQLVYPNATDVVVKSTGLNFVVPGLNNNQTAVANALNGAAHADGLGGPVFNFLLNGVNTLPGYNLALNQLTGEAATGSQQTTFDAMNMFIGMMLDPFNRSTTPAPGSGGASGYASEAYASTQNASAARDAYAMFTKAPLAQTYDPRWSVWASGFGGSQTTDGNVAVGSNTSTSSVYGTAVGADYIFSPRTIAGFALAGGGTNFSVANSGSGHSDLFQAGAFIRHTAGPAYISAALAYGWQDITTNRTVTAAGTSQLRAQFDANAFSGRLEGGYRFVAPWVGGIGITPYAAAQFTTFDLPGYAEQAVVGSNAFALSYGAKDVTDTRTELGIRTDKSFAMIDGILTLRGRVAWAHDYDPDRSIAATFQSLPGASFVVNGAAQASDSALVTASIEKKWLTGWSAAATFEGEFSDVTRSYAGKGVVRYQW